MSLTSKLKTNQEKRKLREKKLLNGEYGLAKTFWLFWFLPIAIFSIIEYFIDSRWNDAKIDTGMMIWSCVILVSLWNTSGNKLWKISALVITGFNTLLNLYALILIFS